MRGFGHDLLRPFRCLARACWGSFTTLVTVLVTRLDLLANQAERRPAPSARLSKVTGAIVCAGALFLLASCTGSEPSSDEPSGQPSDDSALAARPVPLSVTIGSVSGRLAKPDRVRLTRAVGTTISGYFDAAYLAGDDVDLDKAFRSFTRGAQGRARADRDLLTNLDLAKTTDQVTATQKQAQLSVLAPRGTAAGVTARVRLVYVAHRGDKGRTRVTTTGRLLLTRTSAGWRIFGYDLARSHVPVGKAESR
jgi:hypothetical protein